MTDSQKIMDMAKQNNGIITTAMVVDKGLSRGSLKYLADTGALEKTSRGVYTLPEVWEDEFISIQNRFKRGIYSLQTACFCAISRTGHPQGSTWLFPQPTTFPGQRTRESYAAGAKSRCTVSVLPT